MIDRILLKTFGYPGIYDFDIPLNISQSLGLPIIAQNQLEIDYSLRELRLERKFNKGTMFFHAFTGTMNHSRTVLTGVGGDILFGSSQDPRIISDFQAKKWYLEKKRINKINVDFDYLHLDECCNIEGSFMPNERVLITYRSKSFYEPLIVKDSDSFLSPFIAPSVLAYFGSRTRNRNNLINLKNELENYIVRVMGDYPFKNYYGLNSGRSSLKLLAAKNMSRITRHRKMANNFNSFEKVLKGLSGDFFKYYKGVCQELGLNYSDNGVLKTVLPITLDSYYEVS